MVERIVFKGMTSEQVEKLAERDFDRLMTSRARRTKKRNFLRYRMLMEKVRKAGKSGKPIRTHVREAVILTDWIGVKFAVHNGKEFQPVNITAGMVGYRLGDFAFTTKRVQHSAPGIRATKGSKALGEK
jgi:small subunit ribosomal protein S19